MSAKGVGHIDHAGRRGEERRGEERRKEMVFLSSDVNFNNKRK
jgi:hypothetical protein